MLSASPKTRGEWSLQVERWRKSGKSAKAWCRENNLTYTTFLGWHYRLSRSHQKVLAPSLPNRPAQGGHFVELIDKPQPKPSPGISLEYKSVLIHLSGDFDTILLQKCLHALGAALC